jgi:DNA-binding MarR family transcriptional regulator
MKDRPTMADAPRRKIPGLDRLDECTCQNLRKATRVITQFYETILEPSGLKITQLPVLAMIAAAQETPKARDGVTMSHLADMLVMDRTTLTRNLQPLQRLGFVEIATGKDKRARLVRLTAPGADALESAIPLWQDAQTKIVDAVGRFQWGVLQDNLRAIVEAAKESR